MERAANSPRAFRNAACAAYGLINQQNTFAFYTWRAARAAQFYVAPGGHTLPVRLLKAFLLILWLCNDMVVPSQAACSTVIYFKRISNSHAYALEPYVTANFRSHEPGPI